MVHKFHTESFTIIVNLSLSYTYMSNASWNKMNNTITCKPKTGDYLTRYKHASVLSRTFKHLKVPCKLSNAFARSYMLNLCEPSIL